MTLKMTTSQTPPSTPATLDAAQQKAMNEVLLDAVKKKNAARVASCLEHGAQPDCTHVHTRSGYDGRRLTTKTPIAIYAYENYSAEVMETLVRGGMPIDAKSGKGETALNRAVRDRNVGAVKQLLELGASPMAASSDGKTTLDYARAGSNVTDSGNAARSEKIIDMLLGAMPVAREGFNAAARPETPRDPALETADELVVRGKPLIVTRKGAPKPGGCTGGFKL